MKTRLTWGIQHVCSFQWILTAVKRPLKIKQTIRKEKSIVRKVKFAVSCPGVTRSFDRCRFSCMVSSLAGALGSGAAVHPRPPTPLYRLSPGRWSNSPSYRGDPELGLLIESPATFQPYPKLWCGEGGRSWREQKAAKRSVEGCSEQEHWEGFVSV